MGNVVNQRVWGADAVAGAGKKVVPVICRGRPFEMGLAQGAALRAPVSALLNDLSDLEAFRLAKPFWAPYPLYKFYAELKASDYLKTALVQDAAANERMEGIAEGARIKRGSICLCNALEPFLSAFGAYIGCAHGCSAVALRGARTLTGEPMIGRNFDYLQMVKPCHAVRESLPPRGLKAVEFTVAPLAGALDGINEAGLAISYDYAFTIDQASEPAPSISMIISAALERCRTVVEAVNYITSRPRWGSALLMLADESGDIASLELSSTRSCLRRPASGENFCFHTNRFRTTKMRDVEAPADAVINERAPVALRGKRLHESAERRDARLAELLSDPAPIGVDGLSQLLADHGAEGKPSAFSPCVHSDYWNTTTSVQMFPRSRRMRISLDRPCQADYHEFAL